MDWLTKEKRQQTTWHQMAERTNKSLRGILSSFLLLLYEKKYFRETPANIKKLINIWSSRGLSIFGKSLIIKSLFLSKLMYNSSLLPTPAYIIKGVNRLLFKLFWNGSIK